MNIYHFLYGVICKPGTPLDQQETSCSVPDPPAKAVIYTMETDKSCMKNPL